MTAAVYEPAVARLRPDVWRLEALTPVAVVGDGDAAAETWRVLDTWASRRDWRHAVEEAFVSLVDPLPSGTCLRVVPPLGQALSARVVAADGVPREVNFSAKPLADDATRDEWLYWLHKDPVRWWRTCDNAGYLLFVAAGVAARGSVLRRQVARAASSCARLVLPQWEERLPGAPLPRIALDTTDSWCDGLASDDELALSGQNAWAKVLTREASWEDESLLSCACAAATGIANADFDGMLGPDVSYSRRPRDFYMHVLASAAVTAQAVLRFAEFSIKHGRSGPVAARRFRETCLDIVRRHIPLREVLVALVTHGAPAAPGGGAA